LEESLKFDGKKKRLEIILISHGTIYGFFLQ